MAFQTLHYYAKRNGFSDVASLLDRPHANPNEYFSLGRYQCTQNPPFVTTDEDGFAVVGRVIYGKFVRLDKKTEEFRAWLGDGKLKCATVPNTVAGRLFSATHEACER